MRPLGIDECGAASAIDLASLDVHVLDDRTEDIQSEAIIDTVAVVIDTIVRAWRGPLVARAFFTNMMRSSRARSCASRGR